MAIERQPALGNFFALEGLDGVGKSTVRDSLGERGYAILKTPTEEISSLRHVFENQDTRARFLFYLTSVVLAGEKARELSIHETTVCDRYLLTTVAAHDAMGMDRELITACMPIIKRVPVPNVTFVLTADEDTRLERMYRRGANSVDIANLQINNKILEGYREWSETLGHPILEVDTTRMAPREVVEYIEEAIYERREPFTNPRVFIPSRSMNDILAKSQLEGADDLTYEDIHMHEDVGNLQRMVHRRVVKPLSREFSSKPLRREILAAIGGVSGKVVLDVSAGDDMLVFELAKSAEKVVANDISETEMQPLIRHAGQYPNVEFTLGNVVEIPENSADIVICKNTLHHLNTVGQIERALLAIRNAARERMVIMDVENPALQWRARQWNAYYRRMLKDQGGFFMDYAQFSRIMQFMFDDYSIDVKKVKTIKGDYMLATIDKSRR